MINITNMNLGDTIYNVSKHLNYPRKKHVFVDDSGNQWFRYDDGFNYKIKKMKLVGYIEQVVTGIVDEFDVYPKTYYFCDENENLIEEKYDDKDTKFLNNSFYSIVEAEQFIKESKEMDNGMV